MDNITKKKISEKGTYFVLLSLVVLTAATILYFVGFIFYNAYPVFESQGLVNYLTGDVWNYGTNVYGIRTFILATLAITAVTLVLAVPLSIFTAIYLSELASPRMVEIFRPLIELLVGIPSVVYGIFGLYVLENLFQDSVDPIVSSALYFIPIFRDPDPGSGFGVFLASVVLAIMILPTVTTISEDSMRAVAREHREASYALGATRWETIRHVVLPAAAGGILSSVILGMMRAMGETMAVVMLIGGINSAPTSIFSATRPMTTKILADIGFYVSEPGPKSALFGIAAVLFAIEILSVAAARKLGGKG